MAQFAAFIVLNIFIHSIRCASASKAHKKCVPRRSHDASLRLHLSYEAAMHKWKSNTICTFEEMLKSAWNMIPWLRCTNHELWKRFRYFHLSLVVPNAREGVESERKLWMTFNIYERTQFWGIFVAILNYGPADISQRERKMSEQIGPGWRRGR